MYTEKITQDTIQEAIVWQHKQGNVDIITEKCLQAHAVKEAEFDYNLTPEALILEWAYSNQDHDIDLQNQETERLNWLFENNPNCIDLCPNGGSPEA